MVSLQKACQWIGLLGLLVGAGFSKEVPSNPKPGHKPKPVAQVQARDLRRGDEINFDAPPPAVTPFGSKCDVDGDIYLPYSASTEAVSQPNVMSELPISRISLRSKQITQYPVPASFSGFEGHVFRFSFDVSPDGKLYALFNTARRGEDGKMDPAFLIAKYNDDGSIDSYFKVGQMADKRLQPLRMAVFADGDFLLSGTTVLEKDLGSFTGLFNVGGAFVRLLTIGKPVARISDSRSNGSAGGPAKPPSHDDDLEADAKNSVSLESSSLSFSGRDGNVYLLQGTEEATLYVVSPAGEVTRQYHLQPPERGLSPLQMDQAGDGYLFIYYGYVATGATEPVHPHDMITVLESATGNIIATYRMPEEQRHLLPACAASPHEFIFLGASKDNHLALVPYSALW